MRKFWRPESSAGVPGSRSPRRGRRWIGPRAGAAALALTAALGLLTAVSSWGAAAQAATLQVTTTSLPAALPGSSGYDVQLTAAGGTAPYTWTLADGSLPPGFGLGQDGVITGATLEVYDVTTTFTVQVTDSGTPKQTATQQLTMTAYGPPVDTTSALPDATVGTAYTAQATESGGEPPFTWTLTAGQLPPGLKLSADGVVSGTPTQAGTFTFVLEFFDSESPPEADGLQATLTVNPAAPPLAVSTTSLPGGTAGTAYSQALSATGGTTPYTWSLASGTLPAGLALSAGGTISGTPKTAGTSTFTVQVSDAENPAQTATQQLSITVVADKADLAVAVTGPATAAPGGQVTDTITVTDKGPAAASKVKVELDTVGLAGVTPSAGGSTKSVTVLGVTLTATTWSLASLAPGQQVTFTVTGTVPAKGVKTASAAGLALSSTPDPDLLNNAGATSTKITG